MSKAFYAAMYWMAWWLFRPLNALIRYRTTPDNLVQKLALDPAKPVVYILPERSWGDLFALDRICRDQGLPVPSRTGQQIPSAERPGVMYLSAALATRLRKTELSQVIETAAEDPDYDVQVVPVSVFWGRDPGQETSLFKLLFADSVQVGVIRKLFIMLVNSRNMYASFSEPVAFRDFVRKASSPAIAVNKLGRLLHLYFLRERSAALGPRLQSRGVVISQLLASRGVREVVEQEARDQGITLDKANKLARKAAEEIAANYSSATVRILERFFAYVWNRVFRGVEVHGIEDMRRWAQGHEVVYLPSHRSHADYLLLSYVLYTSGLAPPHIAAGVNLNFWPIGGLLRRAGAFYIRRSFGSDRIYTAVFRAYVDSLIARGYPISFYPEGGRSRTGRLLAPKTGMFGMVVESALRQSARKVALVPVYVSYDKVWELGSYFKELRGAGKKKESAAALLKAGKLLANSYGKVHINFGAPLELHSYANKHQADWREQLEASPNRLPGELRPFVQRLALANHRRINGAAVANPVALTAIALLASPQRAVTRAELIEQVGHLIWLLKGRPYSRKLVIPETSPQAAVEWACPIVRAVTVEHPWGDLLALSDRDAVLLTYARNNLQHLLALPSLVANLFRTRGAIPEEHVIAGCRALYPFLRSEFFVRWESDEAEKVTRDMVEVMINLGLLSRRDDGWLARPEISSPAYSTLSMLGRVMGETFERYCMTTWLLSQESGMRKVLERSVFEEDCRLLAERMAVLTGRDSPEFFDKALFRGYLNTLIDVGLVSVNEEKHLLLDQRIHQIAERSLDLLSDESRQTLMQLTTRRPGSPELEKATPV